MKEIKRRNFKEAIESFTRPDKDYIFVRHTFKAGHEVKPHYHKKANEWIVINNGKFEVSIGEKKDAFDLHNEVLVVHFPKGKAHSLSTVSKVSYFVLRDKKDKTIYVGD